MSSEEDPNPWSLMRTETELRQTIEDEEREAAPILNLPPADTWANGPRALAQVRAKARLETLYWALGQTMPRYVCAGGTHKVPEIR